MAKRGGFPGGGMPGNMNNLMKQAQRMQRQMEDAQKQIEDRQAELEAEEVSATSGGGVVEVVVNGKHEVKKITLDPDAVDPEDVEMLEDLITAAVNEAMRKMEEHISNELGKIPNPAAGLGGLGGLPF